MRRKLDNKLPLCITKKQCHWRRTAWTKHHNQDDTCQPEDTDPHQIDLLVEPNIPAKSQKGQQQRHGTKTDNARTTAEGQSASDQRTSGTSHRSEQLLRSLARQGKPTGLPPPTKEPFRLR